MEEEGEKRVSFCCYFAFKGIRACRRANKRSMVGSAFQAGVISNPQSAIRASDQVLVIISLSIL